MMKKLLTIAVLGAAALSFKAAYAHGEAKPKHGGVVQSASDLSFELVPQADSAILYVEDHGQPLASSGMAGKLTVLKGREKTEFPLQPAGGNRLEAKGARLAKGAKAVAVLTLAPGKAVTVRFAVK